MKEIKLQNTNFESFDFKKLGGYEIVENGSDDVYVIQNYPQRYLYQIDGNFDAKKLEYQGYNVIKGDIDKDRVVLIERNFEVFHSVKPCETLASIAQLYGTSVKQLQENNAIKEKVFIGQILKIK